METGSMKYFYLSGRRIDVGYIAYCMSNISWIGLSYHGHVRHKVNNEK